MSERDLKQDNEAPAQGAGKPAGKAPACPICGKPATPSYAPFCSARCTDVDLNRWLTGSYAIPGRPADEEDAD